MVLSFIILLIIAYAVYAIVIIKKFGSTDNHSVITNSEATKTDRDTDIMNIIAVPVSQNLPTSTNLINENQLSELFNQMDLDAKDNQLENTEDYSNPIDSEIQTKEASNESEYDLPFEHNEKISSSEVIDSDLPFQVEQTETSDFESSFESQNPFEIPVFDDNGFPTEEHISNLRIISICKNDYNEIDPFEGYIDADFINKTSAFSIDW